MHCMTTTSARTEHSSQLQRSVVVDGFGAGAASPEYCAAEKKNLEETYVKTYVELSRLKDEYHDLANSTACFDQVETTYKARKTPLQDAIDVLIKDTTKKMKELENLRPRLESA